MRGRLHLPCSDREGEQTSARLLTGILMSTTELSGLQRGVTLATAFAAWMLFAAQFAAARLLLRRRQEIRRIKRKPFARGL